MNNIMSKLGLSTSEGIGSVGHGYSLGGIPIIRYENDDLFTKEELSRYKGEKDSIGLYIGILGRVYDVAEGEQHYGPGNAYHFFTGKSDVQGYIYIYIYIYIVTSKQHYIS
jgi:predicted heme/steroid binding protein